MPAPPSWPESSAAATAPLSTIGPRADAEARTFPVDVAFSPGDLRVGVGMLARVRVPLNGEAEAVIVPKDALVAQGDGRVVYVIGDGDSVVCMGIGSGLNAGVIELRW